MALDVDIKHYALCRLMEGFSGADIKAVATEAGYFAIRKNRNKVGHHDFVAALKKVKEKENNDNNYLRMFG